MKLIHFYYKQKRREIKYSLVEISVYKNLEKRTVMGGGSRPPKSPNAAVGLLGTLSSEPWRLNLINFVCEKNEKSQAI